MSHPAQPQVGGDLVDEEVAGGYVGRSPRTMQMYRYRGEGPPYIKCAHAHLDAVPVLEHRVEPR